MMNDRQLDDDFEATVQRSLGQVTAAVRPDAGLADRLVSNVRAGSTTVVPLDARRRPTRWLPPLLAAAAIVALVVGGVVTANVLSEGNNRAAHRNPSPLHTKPTTPFVPKTAVVPDFHAVNLYAGDELHIWALGDGKCSDSSKTDCPALLASTDAGHSWRALSTPKGLVSTFDGQSCGTNGNLSGPCVDAVTFASESVGYLWSLHEIYVTTDGGRAWSRYVNPATDWDGASTLAVTINSVVRVAPVHQCSSGCPGSVQTAPIGTTNFTPAPLPSGSGQIGLYSSTLATHLGTVYLFAGGVGNAQGGLTASPGVFRFSDTGGAPWTRVSTQSCLAGQLVADDGSLVETCGQGVVVAPPGAGFSAPRRLPEGDVVTVAAASSDAITAADLSHSFEAPAQTSFLISQDGGRTWRRSLALPVGGHSFAFANGHVGYAADVNRSVLYSTRDGGLTWTAGSFAA